MRRLFLLNVVCLLAACAATDPDGARSTNVTAVDRPIAVSSGVGKRLDRSDAAPFGPSEMRGTWMVASASREGALKGDELVRIRGNAAFLQVRSRGDAWYTSSLEPMAVKAELDPLRACVDAANGDYRVHAWVNMNLVADATRLPSDPQHVVRAHPEWLCIPESLIGRAAMNAPRSPEFLAELGRFCAGRKNEYEGLFADPAVPEYRSYVAAIVADIARRYPIAGVHFDYIRYANPTSGVAASSLRAFEAQVNLEVDVAQASEMRARRSKDPLAYVKRFPKAYLQFRQNAVSEMVKECATRAREVSPDIVVSAAVFADIPDARAGRAQDWPKWLADGVIDAAAPMIYTKDPNDFTRKLKAAVAAKGPGKIWAGIGAWLLTPAETSRRIEVARGAEASGFVLFSHHALLGIEGIESVLKSGPLRLRSRP